MASGPPPLRSPRVKPVILPIVGRATIAQCHYPDMLPEDGLPAALPLQLGTGVSCAVAGSLFGHRRPI